MTDHTHDPVAKSWVAEANDHTDFPVQNLPLGVFAPKGSDDRRGGVAIGDRILCLRGAMKLLDGQAAEAALLADADSLNALFADGNAMADTLRQGLFALLTDESRAGDAENILFAADECAMSVPFRVGDYTDFYTGIEHAKNVGALFRPDNPLLPNYKYVPIGYHGRASSIRPSGAEVIRPTGQTRSSEGQPPHFKPSARLDYEMEMAIWTSGSNALGQPIPIGQAGDHIAGMSILNDWSARDLQAWEYQPLGPFLAKNFLSTVSPWLVTSAALAPFRTAQPARPEGDPQPLEYLWDDADQRDGAYNVSMEVLIQTAKMRDTGVAPHRLSKGPMTAMYWTAAQLVAHHTVNGCNLQPGDLLGTGTLSGPDASSFGSLLELSNGGKEPLTLPSGETRTFLEDGDEIVMRAYGETDGVRSIGFGECRGRVTG
ncbi:fumarylacetoacetase [Croceicoccus naphthovorans]|uniref:fumarylacetoacetase n=1 Tax=Croceicoccus naphthovorans TaxID=1348774 RepID=A0A0G3XFS4_9SPHN|nr:fumarylacetoacetase [Croceicoccus naphthovorans]AKM09496.1 fumarylacetoacetase [Croceicoccus naphthovorans]MBB3989771.1 fumarylacetoacetase [Croceicoccus naphthovorans]